MTAAGIEIVRFSDGRLDPFENRTHFVLPGRRGTLCAEPINADWEDVAVDATLAIICNQCRVQKYWLPASGKLDRGASLARVIEPWPADRRKHVTGNDDPGRGRLHRPEHLQLCLSCNHLRGPSDSHDEPLSYDNLCVCDARAWDRDPIPQYGDLQCNRSLCMSCASTVITSGSRWSSYYCDTCRPAVQLLRRTAGRNVIPLGSHSLMNGTSWQATDGEAMTLPQATAFHDQLQTLFANQDKLYELTARRAGEKAARLGFDGHAVLADDYVDACVAAGYSAAAGFNELVAALGDDGIDQADVHQLWSAAHAPIRDAGPDARNQGT